MSSADLAARLVASLQGSTGSRADAGFPDPFPQLAPLLAEPTLDSARWSGLIRDVRDLSERVMAENPDPEPNGDSSVGPRFNGSGSPDGGCRDSGRPGPLQARDAAPWSWSRRAKSVCPSTRVRLGPLVVTFRRGG